MKHFMLDIETLATKATALVWAVGLVEFDPCSTIIENPRIFYVNKAEQLRIRRLIDGDTVRWTREKGDVAGYEKWLGMQSPNEFGEADPRLTGIITLHRELSGIVGMDNTIWCNGASFDFGVMRSLFDDAGLTLPWHFRNEVCMRTLRVLAGGGLAELPEVSGVAHNAADDAVYQAKWVQNLIKRFEPNIKQF